MLKKSPALRISMMAVTTAIVAFFTIALRINIPATNGYISLTDVAVTFVAFTFGPVTAFVAGGLGTAIADLAGGFASWAIISFIVHGLEAFLVSLITGRKEGKENVNLICKIAAACVAVIVVSGGYFLLTGLFLIDFPTALAEVPVNIAQSLFGAVFGLIFSQAVRKAYRKIDDFRF